MNATGWICTIFFTTSTIIFYALWFSLFLKAKDMKEEIESLSTRKKVR